MLLTGVVLIQKRVEELVRIAVVEHPIDIARFTTMMLKEILPKAKEQLGLEFDNIVIYPGPQPRESADIELYRDGILVHKINQKTCVSGDLKTTIRKLKEAIKPWEEGIITAFIEFTDRNGNEKVRTVIFYIPGHIARALTVGELDQILVGKIEEKMIEEGYTGYHIIEVTSALALWRAKQALMAREKAEEAAKEAKEARERAEEAAKEAKEARERAEEAVVVLKDLLGSIGDIKRTLTELREELKKKTRKKNIS